MRKNTLLIQLLVVLVALFLATPVQAVTVHDGLSSSMKTWYEAAAATTTTVSKWGPYVMEPIGTTLYLGFNKSYPSDDAGGAVLASYDGSSLSTISTLNEDAVFRLSASQDTLYVPGYDPKSPDNWDAGNMYVYQPGSATFTKKRYRYGSYQFVDATTTDASGTFTFSNLKATAYQVKVIKPSNYLFSSQHVSNTTPSPSYVTRYEKDNNFDSTGIANNCFNNYTPGLWFDRATTDQTLDAGLRASPGAAAGTPTAGTRNEAFYGGEYTISSQVWRDTDSDGNQDVSETGLAGVRVELYTKDPYFPCAIHMPSMWANEDNSELLVNFAHYVPSPYDGYSVPWDANTIMRSTDGGENWTVMRTIGELYFFYDLFKWKDVIYGTRQVNGKYINETADILFTGEGAGLFSSADNGLNWKVDISKRDLGTSIRAGNPFTTYTHLFMYGRSNLQKIMPFRDRLVFPGSNGQSLYRYSGPSTDTSIPTSSDINTVMDTFWQETARNQDERGQRITTNGIDFSGILSFITDPDFIPANYLASTDDEVGNLKTYQTIATVNDEYLYSLGKNKKLYISSTSQNWIEVVDFSTVGAGADPISIAYWPARNWIVVATTGTSGSLYYLDHEEVVSEKMTKITTDKPSIVFKDSFEQGVELNQEGSTGPSTVLITENGTVTAAMTMTLTPQTLDWSQIVTGHQIDHGKSFIINAENVPSAPATHDLYIPIPESSKDSTQATICPHAQNLDEVTTSCPQGVVISLGETKDVLGHQVTLDRTLLDGQWYLIARGVTGTGGIAHLVGEITTTVQSNTAIGEKLCAELLPGKVAPRVVNILRPSDSSVTLIFQTAETPYDRYLVRYGTDKDTLNFSYEFAANTQTITASIGDLLPGQIYYFQLRAGNGCAAGPWSDVVNTSTWSATPTLPHSDKNPVATYSARSAQEPESMENVELERVLPTSAPKMINPIQTDNVTSKSSKNILQKISEWIQTIFN